MAGEGGRYQPHTACHLQLMSHALLHLYLAALVSEEPKSKLPFSSLKPA